MNKKPRIFITMLLVLMIGMVGNKGQLQADERPNIVLIMADDLGFSDIGCYGSEIKTPALNDLANNGLRFSQFYNTAKCHSSRVSLLTGLYCDQAGGASLKRGVTIAEVLKNAGYFTSMVGKWHLNNQPTDFGFERYWGHLSGATNFFTGDDTFRLNGERWAVPPEFNGKPFYTTNVIADFAIDFMDEGIASGKPFLLYAAFNAPHYPLQAPEADVKQQLGNYDDGWDHLRETRFARQLEQGLFPAGTMLSQRSDHVPAWKSLNAQEQQWESDRMEVYAAMVSVLDRNVGRIVDHLQAKGVLDNTLILFCSDNGGCPFERTRGRYLKPWDPKSYWCYDASWANACNTPFRLYKQNQHEGGISSPLIAYWPKGIKTTPGEITEQPGHLIDFMATFMDVANATYLKNVEGRQVDPLQGKSLAPIFNGSIRTPHENLYFHFGLDRAWREGDWKLVSAKRGRWELYNLATDRTEMHDLTSKFPQRVAAMEKRWLETARNVDRLSDKQLAPVRPGITKLNFRKDTTAGNASSNE